MCEENLRDLNEIGIESEKNETRAASLFKRSKFLRLARNVRLRVRSPRGAHRPPSFHRRFSSVSLRAFARHSLVINHSACRVPPRPHRSSGRQTEAVWPREPLRDNDTQAYILPARRFRPSGWTSARIHARPAARHFRRIRELSTAAEYASRIVLEQRENEGERESDLFITLSRLQMAALAIYNVRSRYQRDRCIVSDARDPATSN